MIKTIITSLLFLSCSGIPIYDARPGKFVENCPCKEDQKEYPNIYDYLGIPRPERKESHSIKERLPYSSILLDERGGPGRVK
jgi:hypothetical protein